MFYVKDMISVRTVAIFQKKVSEYDQEILK